MLQIVYQDENIVAINKPHGLLVHKTSLAMDAKVFALQELRNQLNQHVYPVHRLDRKTSGVLLFALNKEYQSKISALFREGKMSKQYVAIVRGYTQEVGTINYHLKNDRGVIQEAITNYKTLKHYEIDEPFGNYQTSRYSLVELQPLTGRMHQIRKHMAHIFHPIIGDRPHGCNKQNKFWKEKWSMTNMMLHAEKLSLNLDNNQFEIVAEKSSSMKEVISLLENLNI
ncbi:MAG: pseudouridylate synthase [Saprospiraceae bacterium]|nr:pseudouridylate synthase [Saprospiraceae bacterium]